MQKPVIPPSAISVVQPLTDRIHKGKDQKGNPGGNQQTGETAPVERNAHDSEPYELRSYWPELQLRLQKQREYIPGRWGKPG